MALSRAWVRRTVAMAGFTGLTGLSLALLAAGTLCLTSGCTSIGYLAQSARGHLGLLASARPVDEWLHDEATPEALKQKLALTQQLRRFAVSALDLPDNRSYRSYAQLPRPAAVWNLVAAPELSLTLKTWCFPVVGCVGYRGYFALADAEAAASELRQQGWEVSVYPVPAYSTLGYFDFLGGDPLLSTFIQWPEGELARMIFHELSHQVVYASGDTMFNESFATEVERRGGARWLAERATPLAREQYRQFDGRRQEFRALMDLYRERFQALYASAEADAAKRARKAEWMAQWRSEYQALKRDHWSGYAGYDAAMQRANNAALGVQAAYTQWVPAFDALLARENGDFARFYAEAKRLASLPKSERDATLRSLMPAADATARSTAHQAAGS